MNMNSRTRFVRTLFLLMVIVLWVTVGGDSKVPAAAQTTAKVDLNQIKDATLKTLLKGMKYNYDAIESADGTFRMTVTTNPDSKVPYSGSVQSIRWTFSDDAFREETEQIEGGTRGTPRFQVIAFDGTTGYVYIPEDNYGAIISAGLFERSMVSSNVAAFLRVAYRFNLERPAKPPWQIIIERGGTVKGKEKLDALDCYQVQSPPDQKGRRHTWWIAPDRGYCIRLYERVSPGKGPIEYRRFTEETLEFTQKGQFCLPSTIQQVFFTKRHGEAEIWDAKWELKAEELEINPSVDREIFSLSFRSETFVHEPEHREEESGQEQQ